MSDEQQQLNAADNARVAKLTSDAIRASGEKLVADVTRTIEEAERIVTNLRIEADNLVEEIRRSTGEFAERVNSFVANCHGAQEMFRGYRDRLGEMPNGIQDFGSLKPNGGLSDLERDQPDLVK